MIKQNSLILTFSICLLVSSCRKKTFPAKTTSGANTYLNITTGIDSAVAKKPVFKPTRKDIIPNTIVVNDSVAHKSVDGRLYYDLLGHRYWKNYKNGKYYLFNQSMYTNDAFKKPG